MPALSIYPTTRFTTQPTALYLAAVEAMKALAESEGTGRATAAFADATADDGRDFTESSGLREIRHSAHNAAKLIGPTTDAQVERHRERIVSERGEPLKWQRGYRAYARAEADSRRDEAIRRLTYTMSWLDHGSMYGRAGRCLAVIGHPYHLGTEDLRQMVEIADEWDLNLRVDGASWYYPGSTARVMVFRKDAFA